MYGCVCVCYWCLCVPSSGLLITINPLFLKWIIKSGVETFVCLRAHGSSISHKTASRTHWHTHQCREHSMRNHNIHSSTFRSFVRHSPSSRELHVHAHAEPNPTTTTTVSKSCPLQLVGEWTVSGKEHDHNHVIIWHLETHAHTHTHIPLSYAYGWVRSTSYTVYYAALMAHRYPIYSIWWILQPKIFELCVCVCVWIGESANNCGNTSHVMNYICWVFRWTFSKSILVSFHSSTCFCAFVCVVCFILVNAIGG